MRALALAMLTACTVPTYVESDRAFGVGLDGEAQPAWPLVVADCAGNLDTLVAPGEGGRLVDGARVKVVEPVACPPDAASCWWPDSDLVVVNGDLDGLCHELKHRARERLGMSIDYGHEDAAWWTEPQ